MKVIIAGGRDYTMTDEDFAALDRLHSEIGITEVVSGCCSGADSWGEVWARSRSIPVKIMPADWGQYGPPAGPIRNEEMARYADAAVIFPGGKGTRDMRKRAHSHQIKVFRRIENKPRN